MPKRPTASNLQYTSLLSRIGERYQAGRAAAITSINRELLLSYWDIGRYIVEFEQGGEKTSKYGSALLNRLAKDLTALHGRGFSRSNLVSMRLIYVKYPIGQTLSDQLGWSHYVELLLLKHDTERSFYEQQCINERWSVRELKRQKETSLFHRLAASKNKDEILEMAKSGRHVARPEDLLREPYVFEFLQLPVNHGLKETELEERLISHLRDFMLELGRGFAFIGRQRRITVGNEHHYVDLVFYHYILKCFVLIDLKVRKAEAGDIGQMNMYLNYFRNEENREDDNPPVGIVAPAPTSEGRREAKSTISSAPPFRTCRYTPGLIPSNLSVCPIVLISRVHRIFKATKFLTTMTKYIEPRSTDEQLLKFAVIDAVMRSEDLVLLLKIAEDLAVDLPDELKEAEDSADGDSFDGSSIMHPDVPSGRTLEEIVEVQKGSGPAVSFTTQPDFGGDYEKELSLEEELEYIRDQG